MREDPLSQETLNAILARALDPTRATRPEDHPVCVIHRDIFPNSRMTGRSNSDAAYVAIYFKTEERYLELGALVRARLVGPFNMCLVYAHNANAQKDVWRVVTARTRGEGVVVLTYASGSARAREIATRYAEEATEIDLISDFNPEAHYFGESRLSRSL